VTSFGSAKQKIQPVRDGTIARLAGQIRAKNFEVALLVQLSGALTHP
jgi:hypothetical protein